jgi:hypothetical protein
MVHEVVRVVLAAHGLLVKHVDAVEVRIVAAEILAAAADVILAAMYLRRVGIDGSSYAAAPTQVQQLSRRLRLRHSYRREKKRGGRGGGVLGHVLCPADLVPPGRSTQANPRRSSHHTWVSEKNTRFPASSALQEKLQKTPQRTKTAQWTTKIYVKTGSDNR